MKKLFIYFLFLSVFCQYSCGSTSMAGQEKLANGMTVRTYEINKVVNFPSQKSSCRTSEFDYYIEWPVDGPQPLLEKTQKWILEQLEISEYPSDKDFSKISLTELLNERIKLNSPNYDEDSDWYYGVVTDEISISIEADDKKTIVSSNINNVLCGENSLGFMSDRLIMLNTGEEMSYSMFPPIEKMRPFIWRHLMNWDEPVQNAAFKYPDIEYPQELPSIGDDSIHFQWPVSRFENLTATIPISEVYPILSTQLKEFLPDYGSENTESIISTSDSAPTKELLLAYADQGITNGDNEYLSKEFGELIKLAALMPSENPGGRGFYDEILYFWEGGEDLDGCKNVDAEIISVTDGKATGILTFRFDEYSDYSQSHKVTLIKEKFVNPDGKTATRWVVDDYEDEYNGGKKKLLKETINKAGEEFSNGLGQRLMNDPDESGYMTAAEKREYLQEVDKFLNAYRKFKSRGNH